MAEETREQALHKRALEWYAGQLRRRPLQTKVTTSALISVLGELLRAAIKKDRTSLRRIAVFAAYGGAVVAPIMHFWYSFLERSCRKYGTGVVGIIMRLVGDRLVLGPPFIAATILFLQTGLGGSLRKGAAAVKKQFLPVFAAATKLWTPAQLVNFKAVPVQYRVLYGNLVAVGWNVLLAMMVSS
uniref:Peroxisomal membrane protein MPV17 n=1 Tax=Phaeomonas parva TaxID=124430 RepID=A0A7S1XQJ5_9STRA|mmetsp:Transcript_24645/g.77265  ORF Transcript_24645/g.77265 Transcript_24645/m.77265 type:complete len:185 (+) Transcript_24645:225-779(+)|eukprot:CAMPEP_0118883976 /NCGR_PEP_ID=MMETSP1163-20130328/22937_1 /TAXON_ID=124430 /ORGANISM="Phaeomonas parva, Strain CCMP2877" /LENGTH=184 /DNA_ID=CAMNT_0006821595 /DNA_START=190 /DNA_END=744 /DNA_ORIENTATION=-